MAEYIKFMYKTARKFWASVGVVTQEIQDIIGSEIVKEAIINNSDVVMLLDQSKLPGAFRRHQGDTRPNGRGMQEDIHHQPLGEQGGTHFSEKCSSGVGLPARCTVWKNQGNAT